MSSPSFALGAPQTTLTGLSAPISTSQTLSLNLLTYLKDGFLNFLFQDGLLASHK